MALKKPLVLGSDGSIEQLQSGDELDIDLSGVGGGGDTIQMVLAETATNNSVLCITSSGVVNADKDDATKVKVVAWTAKFEIVHVHDEEEFVDRVPEA